MITCEDHVQGGNIVNRIHGSYDGIRYVCGPGVKAESGNALRKEQIELLQTIGKVHLTLSVVTGGDGEALTQLLPSLLSGDFPEGVEMLPHQVEKWERCAKQEASQGPETHCCALVFNAEDLGEGEEEDQLAQRVQILQSQNIPVLIILDNIDRLARLLPEGSPASIADINNHPILEEKMRDLSKALDLDMPHIFPFVSSPQARIKDADEVVVDAMTFKLVKAMLDFSKYSFYQRYKLHPPARVESPPKPRAFAPAPSPNFKPCTQPVLHSPDLTPH